MHRCNLGELLDRTSRTTRRFIAFALFLAGALALQGAANAQKITVTPDQAEAIAKEAYIYGTPMVQGYGAMFRIW
jgi:hypothetical protein